MEPPRPPDQARPAPIDWRSATRLRVGLIVGAPRLRISGSREWKLRLLHGKQIADGAAGARIVVAREGAGTIDVFREGEPDPLWSGGVADTLELVPERGGFSGWSGNWYRGTFRVHGSYPEGLTLVNEVALESYLRSVLPNEIGTPPESDFEAVKAQAVAARSYTLAYLGRRAELGFDLHASVEDQVYAGRTLENEQSDRALEATRGEVLLSDGRPIRALYSSTCGGRTANVEDVWPWNWTPYLRSVRDDSGPGTEPYCALSSNFHWREEWDAGAFLAMLRQYGPPENGAGAALTGDLLDVRVDKRSRCGRVQDLAVTTTSGDLAFHGDRIRWALRRPGTSAILRSIFFKIGVIRGEDGNPAKVVATGAGNGHGIGLCQWGAMGMARAGMDYREILSHYYKSTRLERM
ncbi:MAG: SpoIID/LytB domain-containing protein [Candidatus Eisenbacteria bacterium]|uniref:SpoIID/LytB domain-containing protein n=1 Tax=Eiseniibacteriota bacterium TaxID=2212470 RepID=A0A538TB76_UNCEI|nr:MAG: SpoIID/LytB domain-containing protein [Candidatus Eisenbacteria bacterium]